MMTNPLVSVIVPVYNAEKYIFEAIQSIVNQTYENLEIVIIDDGSTDNSLGIIKLIKDERIIIKEKIKNSGISDALNLGIKISNGKYIARMDADDISLPSRIEKQVNLLENNDQLDICGTAIQNFNAIQLDISTFVYPKTNDIIKANFLFHFCLAHPSIVFKKSLVTENHTNYDSAYNDAEDYDLFERIYFTGARFYNIQEALLCHRIHDNQIGTIKKNNSTQKAQEVQKRQLQRLGIYPTQDEIDLHYSLKHGEHTVTLEFIQKCAVWLEKLLRANLEKNIYPEPEFKQTIKEIWHKFTAGNTKLGLKFAKIYSRVPFSNYQNWTNTQKLKFWIKAFLKKA